MTDFLSQVQETEQKAALLLEKAVARKQSALRKYRSELLEGQKAKLDEAQDKMKDEVQAARADARNSYEAQLKAGEDEARELEIGRSAQVPALLPEATSFFLELL